MPSLLPAPAYASLADHLVAAHRDGDTDALDRLPGVTFAGTGVIGPPGRVRYTT